ALLRKAGEGALHRRGQRRLARRRSETRSHGRRRAMSLSLPVPPAAYDAGDEAQLRRPLERADRNNRKIGTDVEVGTNRLVLKSPNGARWSITVSNTGVISAVAL